MGFFQDLIPVFKKNTLHFSQRRHEAGNIVSFLFKYEKPIFWKAGQHGIFSFPRRMKGGSWRGFSIASQPDEEMVIISTRILDEPSAFKKALMELQPGDQITMRGPFGPFYLDETKKPVVFIAGGIGITPYRSLIKYAVQYKNQAPTLILLLYSDDRNEYAYRKDFDSIVAENEFVKVKYCTSKTLHTSITDGVNKLGNNACYYISGSGKMVNSIKKSLLKQGILKRNIKHEMFIGL